MRRRGSLTLSYIAAGLLSLLVLSTFYLLRNYGPEWAIREFHEAALTGNASELARVSVEGPSDSNIVKLFTVVRVSQSFDIESVSQGPEEATFDIRYYVRGQKVDVNWVVEQTQAGWLIDGKKTMQQSPDLSS